MEPVSMRLYQWESGAAWAREDAARPGKPYRIATEKLSRLAGFNLDAKRLGQLALVFHCGRALQWAPLYPLLRRRTQLAPLPAGLLIGTAMSLLADDPKHADHGVELLLSSLTTRGWQPHCETMRYLRATSRKRAWTSTSGPSRRGSHFLRILATLV